MCWVGSTARLSTLESHDMRLRLVFGIDSTVVYDFQPIDLYRQYRQNTARRVKFRKTTRRRNSSKKAPENYCDSKNYDDWENLYDDWKTRRETASRLKIQENAKIQKFPRNRKKGHRNQENNYDSKSNYVWDFYFGDRENKRRIARCGKNQKNTEIRNLSRKGGHKNRENYVDSKNYTVGENYYDDPEIRHGTRRQKKQKHTENRNLPKNQKEAHRNQENCDYPGKKQETEADLSVNHKEMPKLPKKPKRSEKRSKIKKAPTPPVKITKTMMDTLLHYKEGIESAQHSLSVWEVRKRNAEIPNPSKNPRDWHRNPGNYVDPPNCDYQESNQAIDARAASIDARAASIDAQAAFLAGLAPRS